MFLIDNLLAAPLRGLVFVLKKIHEAVQQEGEVEERAIMADLSALHRALDGGAITEADFDAREQELLRRLDHLHSEDGGDARGDARS
jgi:hypothetical protein